MSENYDEYAFHDNRIHGVSFVAENFRSEIHLDIDCILGWPDCESALEVPPRFKVSKAVLSFFHVTDFEMNIDWGASGFTSAVSGIYIDRLTRQEAITSLRLPTYYLWSIVFTDDKSRFSLGASACQLKLIGDPIVVERQHLLSAER